MSKIFSLLFLACLCTSLMGQSLTQTVKGRVIDRDSKMPLVGVTVWIPDTEPITGGVTDVDGIFRIQSVPVGRVNLMVSSVGYEQKSLSGIVVSSGKEVFLELALVESLEKMEAVEVIADKQEAHNKAQNEMATVSAISLSVEETSRYAATFGDPARAAVSQAGVTTGGDDLLNEIVIRGNSPKGILWRLEGVEIPNPNHFTSVGSSAGGISMLSGNVLSNSDFFTGAFPAQYGNATSGIFDLNLRNGNFDKREHAFQAGLLGIAAASEGPLSKSSNASYLVNYRYSTLALFDHIGIDIMGEQEDITFQDLSFKINLPTRKMGVFSLWGLAGANTYGYQADTVNTDDYYFEDEKQALGVAGLTHKVFLGDRTYLESIVSVSANQSKYQEDSMNVFVWYTEDFLQSQCRISSMINHKLSPRNTLRAGAIYSLLGYDMSSTEWSYRNSRYESPLDDSGMNSLVQGYAQWQHRPHPNVTVNMGMHSTYFSLNGNFYLEPRAGWRWQVSPRGTFTGGLGLHSRMETIALYMGRAEQSDGSYVHHNQNLGFTRAAHSVVGFEQTIGNYWRAKAEVYYQYLYDVPIWPKDTATMSEKLTFSAINSYDGYTSQKLSNGGTGRNCGIEFTIERGFRKNYYLMATTSLYESLYTGRDGVERNTIFNGNFIVNALGGREFVFRDGQRVLSINGRLILAGGKRETPIDMNASREAGFTMRDYSRSYEERLPSYFRVDAGVSYKINKPAMASVFSINVQNVLGWENVAYRYYGPRTDKILTAPQLGMFPNLSYKVEF
ncbi:TonB-dependent receptor [Marinoscillum furvescens]|uniref:Carboxypeptidase-like protein n=1 Tax=Marinoscillum furvescens DSM 4134 TaxID=1122208 RepID=A0A3D9L3J0_MARFU|nr:TonB-dependent receptor [Marinoscillum furvescens]RED99760.1 carboxypeptidase-like protein [Marinoscillum furvescens DSM 4134]